MKKYDEAATKIARLQGQIAQIGAQAADRSMTERERSKIADLQRGIEKARKEQA